MPVVHNIKINLDRDNVLRRIGIARDKQPKPQLKETLDGMIAGLDRTRLFHPSIAYEIHRICAIKDNQLFFDNGIYLTSKLIASLSLQLDSAAVAVCTIGHNLENRVAELFRCGEQLHGFLLDGIGSAAVDALAEEACHIIETEASLLGCESGSPLSPGMPGLDISEQKTLFKLVPAHEINVYLTEQGAMVPLKSLSMIVSIGSKMPTWSKVDMCNRCSLNKTCQYRIHATL